VVTGANEARLDGFIVAGGAADGDYPHDRGAGVYCWDASPVLANCGFTGNSAAADGAAVGGWEGSGPTISGGVFTGNTAGNDGGGVFVSGGSLHLSGCIFSSNAAGDDGGAVAVYDGATATVESCVFSGNTAANGGGAVFTRESDTSLVNCTVTGNSASDGAGAWNEDGTLTVVNSIFWGDDGEEMGHSSAGWGTTSHSDVQGGAEGTGNIDADPLFTGPGEVRLSSGSPCIDAADGDAAPERDLAGNERVDDPATADTGTGSPPWVDMGALEHQP
jgi:predicted outer membrane repeat protein